MMTKRSLAKSWVSRQSLGTRRKLSHKENELTSWEIYGKSPDNSGEGVLSRKSLNNRLLMKIYVKSPDNLPSDGYCAETVR